MNDGTVIVAGTAHVDPDQRDEHVAAMQEMVRRARAFPGCIDLSITADPIDASRVTMFEQFASEDALAEWREVVNPPDSDIEMRDRAVWKHQISSSGPPFDE